MKAQERRQAILKVLEEMDKPLSAAALAERFSVSRQIIVGDIALLRASGVCIHSTARGYLLDRDNIGTMKQVVCRHTPNEMEHEMQIMVDQGCAIQDVSVNHPIYGQLSGPLEISNRYEVSEYIRRVAKEKGMPLSSLTDGVHSHMIRCPSEEAYERVCNDLREAGLLVEE